MADTIIDYDLGVLGLMVETGESNSEIKQVMLKVIKSLSLKEILYYIV